MSVWLHVGCPLESSIRAAGIKYSVGFDHNAFLVTYRRAFDIYSYLLDVLTAFVVQQGNRASRHPSFPQCRAPGSCAVCGAEAASTTRASSERLDTRRRIRGAIPRKPNRLYPPYLFLRHLSTFLCDSSSLAAAGEWRDTRHRIRLDLYLLSKQPI